MFDHSINFYRMNIFLWQSVFPYYIECGRLTKNKKSFWLMVCRFSLCLVSTIGSTWGERQVMAGNVLTRGNELSVKVLPPF